MLEAVELTISYADSRVLGPITGRFGEGVTVLTGPAQSGKTTLLKALCGLLLPSSGDVLVAGRSLRSASPAERAGIRAQFGFVFQNDALFDSMDALANVAFPLTRRGLSRLEAHERASEALARVGLSDHSSALPERLSGGMRKRLGLARAIVAKPRWLLADDPLAGLDPGTSARILGLLLDLWKSSGGLIISAADPLPYARQADEVLVLREGLLAGRGAPSALGGEAGP